MLKLLGFESVTFIVVMLVYAKIVVFLAKYDINISKVVLRYTYYAAYSLLASAVLEIENLLCLSFNISIL